MKKFVTLISLSIYFLVNFASANIDQEIIEQTKKISVVFIGSKKGLSESSFGHVALRLSQSDKLSVTDATIEFVADMPERTFILKKLIRGTGLIDPYTVSAKILPFHQFKYIKTVEENRDVSVIELNLSDAQVETVKQHMIDFQNSEEPEDYTFFKKNCSYWAILGIEKALGHKVNRKTLPFKVQGTLEKAGIVSNVIDYDKATEKRMYYAKRSVDKGLFEHPSLTHLKSNFVENFGSKNLHARLNSYFKLLTVMSSTEASERSKRRARSLARYLKKLENNLVASAVDFMLERAEDKLVIELPKIIGIKGPSKLKKIKHELIVDSGKVYLELKWRQTENGYSPKKLKKRVLVPGLVMNTQNNILSYQGIEIGAYVDIKKANFLLSQKLDYGIDLNTEKNELSTLFYLDLGQGKGSVKMSAKAFKDKGLLALNNVKDFKGTGGSCLAMVLLQKALAERAIFIPENTFDENVDKIEILTRIYNGEYAAIPGYSNISEFTGSIKKTRLLNFVQELQDSQTKGKFAQIMDNVKYQTEIKESSFATLRGLLKNGVLVPITLAMLKKDSRKMVSNVGHVVLAQHMKKLDDGKFELTVYDPNTNINTLLKINKDYKFEYPFYDAKYDYIGGISIKEADSIQIDHAVRSRIFKLKDLRGRTISGKPLFVHPSILLTILN